MEQPRELDPDRLGDHVDRLFRAAWAMCGSREDAEDLVQETYVKVLAKPRFLRSNDDIGYLLSVLRNTFASSYRTAARRPRTEALPEGVEPVDPRLGSRPHAAAEAHEVFALIGALQVGVDFIGASRESRPVRVGLTAFLQQAIERCAGGAKALIGQGSIGAARLQQSSHAIE